MVRAHPNIIPGKYCIFCISTDAISSNSGLEEQMKTLNAAGSVIFGQGQTPNQVST